MTGNRMGLSSKVTSRGAPSSPECLKKASLVGVVPAGQDSAAELHSKVHLNILQRPYQDLAERYAMGEKLGSGTTGVVRRCVDRRTGEIVACKTIDKAGLQYEEDLEAVRMELLALQTVGAHPGIVTFHGAYEDSQHLYVIMELCEGGELFNRIQKKKRYSEGEAAEVCLSLVSVLAFCHQRGIMHRDLKPENVLLVGKKNDTRICVADFGQATFFTPGMKSTRLVGSAFYIAPEVLRRCYGPEADFWSLGVILYIMLAGVPPFFAADRDAIFQRIESGIYDMENGPWKQISAEAKDLVRGLLKMDPRERLTAKEVMEHPWIMEHCPPSSPVPLVMPVATNTPQFPQLHPSLGSPAIQMPSNPKGRSPSPSLSRRTTPIAIPPYSLPSKKISHSRHSSAGSMPHWALSPGSVSPCSVLPENPQLHPRRDRRRASSDSLPPSVARAGHDLYQDSSFATLKSLGSTPAVLAAAPTSHHIPSVPAQNKSGQRVVAIHLATPANVTCQLSAASPPNQVVLGKPLLSLAPTLPAQSRVLLQDPPKEADQTAAKLLMVRQHDRHRRSRSNVGELLACFGLSQEGATLADVRDSPDQLTL